MPSLKPQYDGYLHENFEFYLSLSVGKEKIHRFCVELSEED